MPLRMLECFNPFSRMSWSTTVWLQLAWQASGSHKADAHQNRLHLAACAFLSCFPSYAHRSARRTAEGVKRTAFHEGGHAIVAMCTPGASPVHKATVVPRGHALGMVTQVGGCGERYERGEGGGKGSAAGFR